MVEKMVNVSYVTYAIMLVALAKIVPNAGMRAPSGYDMCCHGLQAAF